MLAQANLRTISHIVSYLDDIIFPCSRSELLMCAEENDAPDSILDAIECLPNYCFCSMLDILSRFDNNRYSGPVGQA